MSVPAIFGLIAAVLASLVALTVLHSYLIIPKIVEVCRKEWRAEIVTIEAARMVDAVRMLEERKLLFSSLMDRIEKNEDQIDRLRDMTPRRPYPTEGDSR